MRIILAVAIVVGLAVIILPFAVRPARFQKTQCISNIKQLAAGMLVYVESNNGLLPSTSWVQPLTQIVKTQLPEKELPWSCPDITLQEKRGGYAFNYAVMGKRLADFPNPETTPLFFETDALGVDVIANLAARCGRHKGGSQIGYLDGHAKFRMLSDP